MKKQRKNREVHLRMNDTELWLLESVANSYGLNLSQTIIRSLMTTQNYLIKGSRWRPVMTIGQIEEQKENMQKLLDKYGDDALEIASINWLEE